MKKLWVIALTVLFVVMSLGTAFSEPGKNPVNAEITSTVNKDIQRDALNRITIPRGASTFSFTADIMGTGIEQTIKVSKDKYGDYNIRVLQQNEILTSLNFLGTTKKDVIDDNEHWYLAYLRNNHTPDIVYCFIDGSGAYLNDLKVFGVTEIKEISKIFDDKPYNIPEKIGSQNQLSIKENMLILVGKQGRFEINLNNNHYKSEHN